MKELVEDGITKKILIVDDRIENIIALEVLLKDFNVEFVRATSGIEALEKTIEYEFALALVDVQMPEMDGYEMVKILRQAEKTKYLPVIFLSAIYSSDHYLIQGIEVGAVDFITKPVHPSIIKGKVKIFLELYEQKKKLELEIEQRKHIEESLRETEKKLTEAKIRAEDADRLKTAFLANMSHEIRTPLTSIVGFAGILSELDLPPEKKKEFAGFIYKSSEGLINIINDILDVSKIEAGQFKINKTIVNLSEVLKEIYASFQQDLKRKKKNHIELKLTLPQKPVNLIFTDENRFKQVINNLLGNAVKFTLEGSIEFGYTIKKEELEFFVKDTGIGIPGDKFSVIFDRFQKLKNEKFQNSAGTGLGLSIVKKIIELLDGKIFLESEINKGTKFTFTIPYKKDEGFELSDTDTEEINPENIDWSSKKILIVEDEYSTYVLLESFLTPTNINLVWAKNGREAIDTFINQNSFSAVLLDIKMPDITGIDAYKQLRDINKKIPVIAQTAYAMSDEKEYLESIGFNGYLTKPIIRREVFKTLISILK